MFAIFQKMGFLGCDPPEEEDNRFFMFTFRTDTEFQVLAELVQL
jgi:hypothetical protein